MAGIRFDGFAMKVILWILNLADFVSHGLMTSQNGYRHTYRLLTVVTFRTQRVPSSPSSTVFSIIPCYSFPVFRLQRYSHCKCCECCESHCASCSLMSDRLTRLFPVLSFSLRECNTSAQDLPLADTSAGLGISTVTT